MHYNTMNTIQKKYIDQIEHICALPVLATRCLVSSYINSLGQAEFGTAKHQLVSIPFKNITVSICIGDQFRLD